jgi:hypothetical protein
MDVRNSGRDLYQTGCSRRPLPPQQQEAEALVRATSKTKGPASWGLVLGGTTLNRAVAHFPIWRARQAKVRVDLWPNLAKQVQTFWNFAAHLYF